MIYNAILVLHWLLLFELHIFIDKTWQSIIYYNSTKFLLTLKLERLNLL